MAHCALEGKFRCKKRVVAGRTTKKGRQNVCSGEARKKKKGVWKEEAGS